MSVEGVDRPANRLAGEASPYLRQHMYNPVDWYPWGEEAFTRAREEDRPILLSVGYAACHWCHVMERDAFSVEEVADLINRHFVAVKVDREERPDVDALYQGVVQLMGRSGGWPLTVFLTPDGRPFFGGTYFPPEDRFGLPGFRRVLLSLAEAWALRRDEVERSAAAFAEGLGRLAELEPFALPEAIGPRDLIAAADRLVQQLDPRHGGFFGAPKFPHPMELSFLLRMAAVGVEGMREEDRRQAEAAVRLSLDSMAAGGIYDQIGGGFHRYAVDAAWAVPHFEKMLYDNALLLRLYAEASVAFGSAGWGRIAREIAGWMEREMTAPEGGLYASQDADSEGVEGKFFVWTPDELGEALGDDADLAAAFFGVDRTGNFEGGTTVLHLARDAESLARERGEPVEAIEAQIASVRARLFAARSRRIPPATDDKILAGWNGLAIGALAAAGRLLSEPRLVEQARAAADCILDRLLVDGRLMRLYRDGKAKQEGFLDDHAWLCEGLIDLFEATGEKRWLDRATRLAEAIVDRFWDEERGVFFLDPADRRDLLLRIPALHDDAVPSGGSSATRALLVLHALTGEGRFGAVAQRYLELRRGEAVRNPFSFGHLLCAAWLAQRGLVEVAVLGPAGPEREALLAAARRGYRPWIVAYAASTGVGPALEGRRAMDGRPAAYVCRGFACEAPRTDPAALAQALEEG